MTDLIKCVVLEPLSLGGQHESESGLPDILNPSDDPTKPTVHDFEKGRAIPLINRGRVVELAKDMDFDMAATRLLMLPGVSPYIGKELVIDGLKAKVKEYAPKAQAKSGSSTSSQGSQGGKGGDSKSSEGSTP